MKKICVYTGSRANYSSCYSIMKSIQEHPGLKLQTIVGGAAILDRYGNIEDLIKKDGFEIDAKIYMIVEGENPTTMAKSTGLGLVDVAMVLNNLKPDMLVVVGDRFDVMAPVIAAAYMNIPIAHTMGGEVSGTIDESIRHAITKFSHLHFPANEDARKRIIRLGEKEENVFNVGCPRIDLVKRIVDDIRGGDFSLSSEQIFKKYKGVGEKFDLQNEKFLLVSHHPVTTEFGENRAQMEEILSALNELKMPTIMIWPNADAGSDEISKAIRTFREKYQPQWLHLFINLPTEVYVYLMEKTVCFIGNSSSAVREGAYIGTPSVNIGSRQNNRQKGANMIDVPPKKEKILTTIKQQLNYGKYSTDPIYGSGSAGKKIADIVSQSKVTIQKTITY